MEFLRELSSGARQQMKLKKMDLEHFDGYLSRNVGLR